MKRLQLFYEKIKVGISSCLLGKKVRYDGGHKWDRYITETLGQYFEWVPVCPEVECGLPVPRKAMHLIGPSASPRLVTVKTGIDNTKRMQKWAKKKLKKLEKESLSGFIFKSKSPSSGIEGVKVYTPSGMLSHRGKGIFGNSFMQHFPLIPVIDDDRLHDPSLRENFIEQVFVYRRWNELTHRGFSIRDLINFHTKHKLLIMSHSLKHYSALSRLIANSKRRDLQHLQSEYINLLMQGIRLQSTVKKNTNVLLHIIGYFKKHLTSDEKKELLEHIEHYHKGYMPLIVPIVLINHYVRKFNEPHLKKQYYLNPHPLELMLRNHV